MRLKMKFKPRLNIIRCFFCVLLVVSQLGCSTTVYKTEVLVIGGGAAGTAAALASARAGAKTVLVEKGPWLGGMLTSAGVSAVDGNTKLPGGIWGEFRDSLIQRYGSAEALKTGWVSNHMFEPSIGAAIFSNMTTAEKNLDVFFETPWQSLEKIEKGWKVSVLKDGKKRTIISSQLIDATELGDLAAAIGVPYHVGMDSKDRYNEAIAPPQANNVIQDLTFVLILKEYDQPVAISKPEGYDPTLFYCATANKKCKDSTSMNRVLWAKDKMITYGKLPNKKYMINWPINGNDFYTNTIEMTSEERDVSYEKAKLKSLQFLYYLQTELGFKNFGIASNEFPTEDGFPLIPYHRESRRIVGEVTLTVNYIAKPYDQSLPLYRTAIAVGDYPVDHHHAAHPKASELPELHFYPVPSYSIPMGSLIPTSEENLIITEKSISVSNIVNGTTRLQPVVLQLGQAAGVMAAIAYNENKPPREISVRRVQKKLLEAGGYLLPFLDVPKNHPHFKPYQRIGVTGILRGVGKNVGWENQTWFYPEKPLKASEVHLAPWISIKEFPFPKHPKIKNVLAWFNTILPEEQKPKWLSMPNEIKRKFTFNSFNIDAPMSRGQFAVLLDTLVNPFAVEIQHNGKLW